MSDSFFEFAALDSLIEAHKLATQATWNELSNKSSETENTMKPTTVAGGAILSVDKQFQIMADEIFEDIFENILHEEVLKAHREEKMLRAQSASIFAYQTADLTASQEPSLNLNASLTPSTSLTGSPAAPSSTTATGSKVIHTKSGTLEDGKFYLKGNPLETQKEILCPRCGLQRQMSHSEVRDLNKKYCERLPFVDKPGLDIYGQPFILEAGGSNRIGKQKEISSAKSFNDPESTPGSLDSPATTPPDGTSKNSDKPASKAPVKKPSIPLLDCKYCNRKIACNRFQHHIKSCLGVGRRRKRNEPDKDPQNAYGTPNGSKAATPMPEQKKGAAKSPKRDRDDNYSDEGPKKKKSRKPAQKKVPQKKPAEKKKTKAQLATEAKTAKAAAAKAAKEEKEGNDAKDDEERDSTLSATTVTEDKLNGEVINKKKRKADAVPNGISTALKVGEEDEKDSSITLSQSSAATVTGAAPLAKKQKMTPNDKPAKNPVSIFKGRQHSPENPSSGGRNTKSPIPLPKLGTPSVVAPPASHQSSSSTGARQISPSKPLNANGAAKPKPPKKDGSSAGKTISPSKGGKTLPKPPLTPMKPKNPASTNDLGGSPTDASPTTSPTLKKKTVNGSPLKKSLKEKDTEAKEKKEKPAPKATAKKVGGKTPAANKTAPPSKPRASNADDNYED